MRVNLHARLSRWLQSPQGERFTTVAGLVSLMAMAALLMCCIFLGGCAQAVGRVERVNVPVPVVCKEAEPARPAMPTESLKAGVSLDAFAAAAIAEIERREGYEGLLRSALQACAGGAK